MKRCIFTLAIILLTCSVGFSQQWPNVPGKLMMLTDSLTAPIGKLNGIVVTLNPALNKVFRNNQVYNSYQTYSSSSYPFMLDLYTIECNCNERLLKDTLESAPFYAYVELINQVVLLGAEEEIEPSALKVYPIPFVNKLSYEIDDKIVKAEIFDITGKLIYKKENPVDNLDISELKKGQYLLLLTSKNQTHKQQILKE